MTTRELTIVTQLSGNARSAVDNLASSLGVLPGKAGAASSELGSMSGVLDVVSGSAVGAIGGIAGVGAAVISSVNASREGRAAQAQLAAVLDSTRHAAGLSQEELNKHAAALQAVTNYGDETTNSVQSLLLTFTKIGREVFPDATKTALDMSTALGQDTKSSAIQLGKALNDPIEGVTALRRVGVSFTDDQQKLIKTMVESGDIIGAQNLILRELQTEFGGSAEAARQADGGFIALQNSVGDLGESFGNLITTANDSFGVVEGLIGLVQNLTETVDQAGEAIQSGPVGALQALSLVGNPLAPVMAALGYDLFPTLTASTNDLGDASQSAADSLKDQADAHGGVTDAIHDQEAAAGSLQSKTLGTLISMGRLEEDHKNKVESLMLERAKLTGDIMNAENMDIKNKLVDRQVAINNQLAQEKMAYQEKAEELKRTLAAQVLEQSGALERLTGIAGITAAQYVQAVELGAIKANKEVETQMSGISANFDRGIARQKTQVQENSKVIAGAWETSFSSINQAHNTQTNNAISNWNRQRDAAEHAVPPIFTPHSPTPYEMGLRGIAAAADQVTTSHIRMATSIVGAAVPASELAQAREGASGFWSTASGKSYASSLGFGKGDHGWTRTPQGYWRRYDGSIWDANRQVQLADSSGAIRPEDSFSQNYSFGAEGFDPDMIRSAYAGASSPTIVVNYNPAVALGSKQDVKNALRPAWEELARERESR